MDLFETTASRYSTPHDFMMAMTVQTDSPVGDVTSVLTGMSWREDTHLGWSDLLNVNLARALCVGTTGTAPPLLPPALPRLNPYCLFCEAVSVSRRVLA